MAKSNLPWQSFEGHTFNGLYPLSAPLQSGVQGATYRTVYGLDRLPATVRFVPAEPQDVETYLQRWRRAATLSHPNLLPVYDCGEGMLDDAKVVFVVSAYAEDRLGDALANRALTEEETQQVAVSVAEALVYVHEQGLVHGNLDAAHVVAVDEQVKIASEDLQGEGSPAGDMERFGLLLMECLTQQRQGAARATISGLAPRFRAIVENSTRNEPAARWDAARVLAVLRGELNPEPESRQEPPGKKLGYAAIAMAAIVLIGGSIYLTGSKKQAAEPAPASPAPTAAVLQPERMAKPDPAAKPDPIVKPQPVRAAGNRERSAAAQPGSGNQYVIIATYNRMADAEKRAKGITAKWPRFPAQVHAPNSPNPPYLVTIGANLSKSAAMDLQRKALAAGLPRDTYFQSF